MNEPTEIGSTAVDTAVATPAVDVTPITNDAPVVDTAIADPSAGAAPTGESTATTAAGAAAEAAGATPQQVAAIEGRLNGQPFTLDPNVQIPWKRGNEQGFATIAEIQKAHMFERDYRVQTAKLADQRRDFQTERLEAEKVRRQMDVERKFVEREQQRVLEAVTSPDEEVRERHARHFHMLQNDPDYAERYQKSLRADAYEAVQQFEQEISEQQQANAILQDVQDTALKLSEEFPGVDVQRALARYGRDVSEGRAPLKESALRAVFADEHAYVQRSVTPFQSELDALKAEIALLKSGTVAEKHNQSVRTTIGKAASARVVPAVGRSAPPSPVTSAAAAPARPRDRREAMREYLRNS